VVAARVRGWTRTVVHSFGRGDLTVHFEPLGRSVPGFTHRVVLVRERTLIAKDWLSKGFRPAARVAAHYAEKHGCAPAAMPSVQGG
jgi:hypothetical protein